MTDQTRRDPERDPDGDPETTHDWSLDDVRDAARAARDAARIASETAREAARQAREQIRDAQRTARQARRDERRRHHFETHGMGIDLGFDPGKFAKGFLGDFVTDASGEAFSETVTGTFDFEHMPRLRVRNISGDTVIRVGEAGRISVVAKKHVSASSEDRAKRLLQNLEVRMEQHGDELQLEPHLYEQERGWVDLFRGKRFRVDFEISVPQECAVDAHTVSGDLSVNGVRGPLEAQSVSGEVAIDDVQGPLRLKSVSGDVECRQYVGHVEGTTVSGDVTFDAARLRSIHLSTVSGDVEIAGVLEPAREHQLKTISGDVDLAVTDPNFTVEFRTASGDLECELPARVTRHGKKEYSVELGAAQGSVTAKTVSGDLTIRGTVAEAPGAAAPARSEPAAQPSVDETVDLGATAPMEAGSRQEVRDVLERLAKGELGVDDAAAALDDVRRGR